MTKKTEGIETTGTLSDCISIIAAVALVGRYPDEVIDLGTCETRPANLGFSVYHQIQYKEMQLKRQMNQKGRRVTYEPGKPKLDNLLATTKAQPEFCPIWQKLEVSTWGLPLRELPDF